MRFTNRSLFPLICFYRNEPSIRYNFIILKKKMKLKVHNLITLLLFWPLVIKQRCFRSLTIQHAMKLFHLHSLTFVRITEYLKIVQISFSEQNENIPKHKLSGSLVCTNSEAKVKLLHNYWVMKNVRFLLENKIKIIFVNWHNEKDDDCTNI